MGKIVNEHGIPLAAKVMDGSTSDIEWNNMALELANDLQKSGLNKGIYIADSKLMTAVLARKMLNKKMGVKFISRCPANFHSKLEAEWWNERTRKTSGWILGS